MRSRHWLLIFLALLMSACAASPKPIVSSIPTATSPDAPLALTPDPTVGESILWQWNFYDGPESLHYDPEDWELLSGGERIIFVYEGNEGLVHQAIPSCILSLVEGHGIPFELTSTFEEYTVGEYAASQSIFRNEANMIVFVLFNIANRAFLLAGPDLELSPFCIAAALCVLETYLIAD